MVSGRQHPHPFRLIFRLHPWRPDLTVLEGILLHGPHLVSARFLALLHVRPQPGRGGSRGRPIRELHRQAHCILDARRPELLSFVSTLKDGPGRSERRDKEKLMIYERKKMETWQDLWGSTGSCWWQSWGDPLLKKVKQTRACSGKGIWTRKTIFRQFSWTWKIRLKKCLFLSS